MSNKTKNNPTIDIDSAFDSALGGGEIIKPDENSQRLEEEMEQRRYSSPMPVVKIKLLNEAAALPEKKSAGAAAYDLVALTDERIFSGVSLKFSLGFAMEIPEGYVAEITSRSGLACTNGIIVINAPGIIDSDYRGEVVVVLHNLTLIPVDIHAGDRIAQMLIRDAGAVSLQVVEELSETERGTGGLGSTGK